MTTIKTLLTLALAGILCIGVIGVGSEVPTEACPGPKATKDKKLQAERLAWKTDLSAALADAKKAEQPVMIFFGTDKSRASDMMVDKTFTDKEVQKAIKGFVKVHVDMTDCCSKELKQLADKYGVKAKPAIVFIDSKGEQIRSLQIDKFVEAKDLLSIVKQVASL